MHDDTCLHTLMASLKACAKQRDLYRGSRLHADIVKLGFLKKDVFVGSAVVSMYAKCGSLAKAVQVFNDLPVRNVVSWNALIAGYTQHQQGQEALNCFEQMQDEGVPPNSVTFVCILKACGSMKAVDKGEEIHAQVAKSGLLHKDVIVGNALVDMYSKCGLLGKSRLVFDELPTRNIVSWTMLIAGYAQHGQGEEALACYKRMQLEGLTPNAVTFICVLKACGSIGAAGKGCEIHAEIVREGWLQKDVVVGNALVGLYAKCGLCVKAQEVFDILRVRDVITWSALIGGYGQLGHGEQALKWFDQMQLEGFCPNAVTLLCTLKACSSIETTHRGDGIYARIVVEGYLEKDVFVGTALVDMYAKYGLLVKSQEVFDRLPVRNVVSWNALISGYAQHARGEEALKCFERMQLEKILPNIVTFVCGLKACASIGAADKGQSIYAELVRQGLCENVIVSNALVDMYAKCGLLAKSREVFDKFPARNVVSWNALIGGYIQHGHCEEAMNCFVRMQGEGFSPDAVTFVCILKACANLRAIDRGQEIHAEIAREGLLEKDIGVGNALVDMYAKCGLLAKAQEVFNNLRLRDLVAWNALLAGYAKHGCGEEALNYFHFMQLEDLSPNAATFICILKACGILGASGKGLEIHDKIARQGALEQDTLVGTALVDMYAKCGLLAKAQEVFDHLPGQDVVLWNALITGYALIGNAELVLYSFNKMLERIKPDRITFIGVLSACGHTGLLEEGQVFFEAMSTSYGIVPTLEHYNCMVDLFARAGCIGKAVAVIQEMPFCASLALWVTVLGACQAWGNMELAELAFEHVVQLDEKDAAAYVCLSNVYSGVGRQRDIENVQD